MHRSKQIFPMFCVLLALAVAGLAMYFDRVNVPQRPWSPADVLDRKPSDVELYKLVDEGHLAGKTLEEASRYLGGYKFVKDSSKGTYNAYIEQLGAPVGIYIVIAEVDRETGKIRSVKVKYD